MAPATRTRRRLAPAVGALLAVCVLVAGVPAALIALSRTLLDSANPFDGMRWPWQWTGQEVSDALTKAVSEDDLITTLARVGIVVAWAALAVVVVNVAAELVVSARRRETLPSVRGLGWSQAIARRLAAGLLAATSFVPVAATGASPLIARTPAVVQQLAPERPIVDAGASVAKSASTRSGTHWQFYRVQRSESIRTIALRLAGGDAARAKELAARIVARNDGRTMADGQRVAASHVEPGWEIEVPVTEHTLRASTTATYAADPAPDPTPVAIVDVSPTAVVVPEALTAPPSGADTSATTTHVVGRGETLSSIAADRLGDPNAWPQLWDLNRDRLNDPDELQEGMPLVVPTSIAAPPALPSAEVHIVGPGESLWSIAADRFGDPNAWPQLWELNRDRDFAGVVFTDPDVLHAGWDLYLTAPGAQTPAPPSPADPAAAASPAPPPPPLTPVPAPTAPGSEAPTLPPSAPTTVPSPPTTPAAPPTTPAPLPTTAADQRAETTADGYGDEEPAAHAARLPGWALPAGVLSSTMLATGVALLVAGKRRRRLREAGPRDLVPPPDPTLAETDVAVAVAADIGGLDRMGLILQAVGAAITDRRLAVVPEAVLRHPDGEFEILLSGPAPAPAPFEARSGQRIWAYPIDGDVTEFAGLAGQFSPVCPALTMLGTLEDDAELYVDLEAAGMVQVDAPAGMSRDVLRALTVSVAVSPFADICSLLAVGFDPGSVAVTGHHVDCVDDLATALGRAQHHWRGAQQSMAEHRLSSTFALRAAVRSEVWEPAVVMCSVGPLAEPDAVLLADLTCPGGRGVAALVTAPVRQARWRVRFDPTEGGTWWVDPLGMRLRPVQLAAAELEDIAALVAMADTPLAAPMLEDLPPPPAEILDRGPDVGDVAGARQEPGDTAVPPDESVPTTPAARQVADEFREPPWKVMVHLFGSLEATNAGGERRDSPARAMELLAWVARHPNGTKVEMVTDLWPDQRVENRSVNNLLTKARGVLAELAGPYGDGKESCLILDGSRRLRFADDWVASDAALLEARLAFARTRPIDVAVEVLRPAIELIRGLPLAGSNLGWRHESSVTTNLTHLGVAVALETTTRAVHVEDFDLAVAASQRGLSLVPDHPRLTCLQMDAWGGMGEVHMVRTVYQAYAELVSNDRFGDGELDPDVVATYQRWMSTPRDRAGTS